MRAGAGSAHSSLGSSSPRAAGVGEGGAVAQRGEHVEGAAAGGVGVARVVGDRPARPLALRQPDERAGQRRLAPPGQVELHLDGHAAAERLRGRCPTAPRAGAVAAAQPGGQRAARRPGEQRAPAGALGHLAPRHGRAARAPARRRRARRPRAATRPGARPAPA
jgi:hypothetical protein